MKTDTQQLLDVREVAELLRLSVGGVYHLVSQKRIPVVKLSARCIRFDKAALAAWIEGLVVPVGLIEPTSISKKSPVIKSNSRSRNENQK